MCQLYSILTIEPKYWDKKNFLTQQSYNLALSQSSTVYVGNLSFYTPQDSIKQLFSRIGPVQNIIMGIDNQGLPCGFCFVVYEKKQDARMAVEYVSKVKLGGRIIRVDIDPGYQEGREKGRGSNGLQRRDDFRNKEDPQRPKKGKDQTAGAGQGYGYQGNNQARGGYHNNRYNNNNNDRSLSGYKHRDNNDNRNSGDTRQRSRDWKPREWRGGSDQQQPSGGRGYNNDRGDYRNNQRRDDREQNSQRREYKGGDNYNNKERMEKGNKHEESNAGDY